MCRLRVYSRATPEEIGREGTTRNFRGIRQSQWNVQDIQSCYKLWKSRGAEFITEPIPKYGEIRCYIRDPDGYIIEVGQSKPDFTYG
jgi:hypothetical protein